MKLSEELYHLYDIHDPIKHDTKGLIKGWAIKAGQLESVNTELLEALYAFVNHVPELWGDEVQDGYIRLNISADTIDKIEAAIAKGE